MEGELVEALPVDILSHDTVEAKLLQPAVNVNVTLYEDCPDCTWCGNFLIDCNPELWFNDNLKMSFYTMSRS